jgi:hypothetical protein
MAKLPLRIRVNTDHVRNEPFMKRYPTDLSPEDRRTYRVWTGSLFLSYLLAVFIAIGFTLMNEPASNLGASNETKIARSKATSASIVAPPAPVPIAKH